MEEEGKCELLQLVRSGEEWSSLGWQESPGALSFSAFFTCQSNCSKTTPWSGMDPSILEVLKTHLKESGWLLWSKSADISCKTKEDLILHLLVLLFCQPWARWEAYQEVLALEGPCEFISDDGGLNGFSDSHSGEPHSLWKNLYLVTQQGQLERHLKDFLLWLFWEKDMTRNDSWRVSF